MTEVVSTDATIITEDQKALAAMATTLHEIVQAVTRIAVLFTTIVIKLEPANKVKYVVVVSTNNAKAPKISADAPKSVHDRLGNGRKRPYSEPNELTWITHKYARRTTNPAFTKHKSTVNDSQFVTASMTRSQCPILPLELSAPRASIMNNHVKKAAITNAALAKMLIRGETDRKIMIALAAYSNYRLLEVMRCFSSAHRASSSHNNVGVYNGRYPSDQDDGLSGSNHDDRQIDWGDVTLFGTVAGVVNRILLPGILFMQERIFVTLC